MKTIYTLWNITKCNTRGVCLCTTGMLMGVLVFIFLSSVSTNTLIAQTVITQTTPGTYTFTVPCGVTQITVECWGAGGSGMGNTGSYFSQWGGGGGAYASKLISVSAGWDFNYTVGAGGIGTYYSGVAGQTTSFQDIVYAAGGTGGLILGGLGGSEIDCSGDIVYHGGNGYYGGGGSAGPFSNGNNATSEPGGTAVFDGGSGGHCLGYGYNGLPGGNPGGGGGGAGGAFWIGYRSGGSGGNGQIRITYNVSLSSELCNGIDDDCNGSIDDGLAFENYYLDIDGDGYGNMFATPVLSCTPVAGSVTNTADCDDTSPTTHMFAPELCNGIDDNCNTLIDDDIPYTNYYQDNDGDGYGDIYTAPVSSCLPVPGLVITMGDCNDADPDIHEYAAEVCNGIDDNCDGLIDEGVTLTMYYVDADGDGYGNMSFNAVTCDGPPAGYVADMTDCDDTNPDIYPSNTEMCNSIDDDCDGIPDDGIEFIAYYADADGDGYGDIAMSSFTCDGAPAGYVTNMTDCNDADPMINPSVSELCNAIDDDCSGAADDGITFITYYADDDADGYGDVSINTTTCSGAPAGYVADMTDCNDADPMINPSVAESCNAIDDDCDGITDNGLTFTTYYADSDSDGYGDVAINTTNCSGAPAGYVADMTDCDDTNSAISPLAAEVCNGIDDDCNGSTDDGLGSENYYPDLDADGYGNMYATPVISCTPVIGSVTNTADCDDGNPTTHLYAPESCNGIDDNCNTLIDDDIPYTNYYQDNDGDGYGDIYTAPVSSCSPVEGLVTNTADCDDTNPTTHMFAPELCNGIDDNCNTFIDEDVPFTNYYLDNDGDGYGFSGTEVSTCDGPPPGYVTDMTDCNDMSELINPSVAESCNAIDDNCDGAIDEGLVFITYYFDNDGDGYGFTGTGVNTCDGPPPGYVTDMTDCNDINELIYPSAGEYCNAIDDDCDGITDEGFVNTDGDMLADCVDPDDDDDGVSDESDNCALEFNPTQQDTDGDGLGDVCDTDDDGDFSLDVADNCPLTYNPSQLNTDGDAEGDVCDADDDNDGDPDVTDCADLNPLIYIGATETCNALDDDCDGTIDEGVKTTYYIDTDGDGFGWTPSIMACTLPAGYAVANGDCNNSDNTIYPGATEIAGDGIDQNCDGQELCYTDADNDGARTFVIVSSADTDCSDAYEGLLTDLIDCDDTDPAIGPLATEVCNGIDDNCDGLIDEDIAFTLYYIDEDGDGYGNMSFNAYTCDGPPVGFVADMTDCDDTDPDIYPSNTEMCNGIDDNCDGYVDEGITYTFYYLDADEDGYGNMTISVYTCDAPPTGYVADMTDCDDGDPLVNISMAEACNDIDDDCNGLTDDGLLFTVYFADADGDGYGNVTIGYFTCDAAPEGYVADMTDCNDADPLINPSINEICNAIDDDCDGATDNGLEYITYYFDNDGDGYGLAGTGVTTCDGPPPGYVADMTDCNDINELIYPSAGEYCNAIDDDCDGAIDEGLVFITYYFDSDSDGYGYAGTNISTCDGPPMGHVADMTDCNDMNALINPSVAESCNAIDDNCDGAIDEGLTFITYYLDNDGDGYGYAGTGVTTCDGAPLGYVADMTDCNDMSELINPSVVESCNAIDDDCDGIADNGLVFTTYYADIDGDGFGNADVSETTCDVAPAGYVVNFTDCDDAAATVNPGAEEICDGIDNNCDGVMDETVLTATIIPSGLVSTCKGTPVLLTANTGAGYTYQWFKNGSLILGAVSSTYNANKPGNYQVQVIATGGCLDLSDATTLQVNAAPKANIYAPNGTSLCATVKLKASWNAHYTWQWRLEGAAIPGATNYLYVPTVPGAYSCTVTNNVGCSRTTATVLVTACKESGETQLVTEDILHIYPNPTMGNFTIQMKMHAAADMASIYLINLRGELVYTGQAVVENGNLHTVIKVDATIPGGVYFVRVQCADNIYVKELVIQR